jgi:hypothetical protein
MKRRGWYRVLDLRLVPRPRLVLRGAGAERCASTTTAARSVPPASRGCPTTGVAAPSAGVPTTTADDNAETGDRRATSTASDGRPPRRESSPRLRTASQSFLFPQVNRGGMVPPSQMRRRLLPWVPGVLEAADVAPAEAAGPPRRQHDNHHLPPAHRDTSVSVRHSASHNTRRPTTRRTPSCG